MLEQQPQDVQLSTASSLSFRSFLGHTKTLSTEESDTAAGCSPPATFASYQGCCTEAAARFHCQQTELAQESGCTEEFLSRFSTKGSGEQRRPPWQIQGGFRPGMVDTGVGVQGPCCAHVEFLMQPSSSTFEML